LISCGAISSQGKQKIEFWDTPIGKSIPDGVKIGNWAVRGARVLVEQPRSTPTDMPLHMQPRPAPHEREHSSSAMGERLPRGWRQAQRLGWDPPHRRRPGEGAAGRSDHIRRSRPGGGPAQLLESRSDSWSRATAREVTARSRPASVHLTAPPRDGGGAAGCGRGAGTACSREQIGASGGTTGEAASCARARPAWALIPRAESWSRDTSRFPAGTGGGTDVATRSRTERWTVEWAGAHLFAAPAHRDHTTRYPHEPRTGRNPWAVLVVLCLGFLHWLLGRHFTIG